MVTSPTGKGVIAMGGITESDENSKEMFELSQSMEWTRLEQTLQMDHYGVPLALMDDDIEVHLDESIEINENESVFCDCDEDQVATHWCRDCSSDDKTEFLCEKCVLAHKVVRVTRDHVIEEVAQ